MATLNVIPVHQVSLMKFDLEKFYKIVHGLIFLEWFIHVLYHLYLVHVLIFKNYYAVI